MVFGIRDADYLFKSKKLEIMVLGIWGSKLKPPSLLVPSPLLFPEFEKGYLETIKRFHEESFDNCM